VTHLVAAHPDKIAGIKFDPLAELNGLGIATIEAHQHPQGCVAIDGAERAERQGLLGIDRAQGAQPVSELWGSAMRWHQVALPAPGNLNLRHGITRFCSIECESDARVVGGTSTNVPYVQLTDTLTVRRNCKAQTRCGPASEHRRDDRVWCGRRVRCSAYEVAPGVLTKSCLVRSTIADGCVDDDNAASPTRRIGDSDDLDTGNRGVRETRNAMLEVSSDLLDHRKRLYRLDAVLLSFLAWRCSNAVDEHSTFDVRECAKRFGYLGEFLVIESFSGPAALLEIEVKPLGFVCDRPLRELCPAMSLEAVEDREGRHLAMLAGEDMKQGTVAVKLRMEYQTPRC
jgi:hypothetical protein